MRIRVLVAVAALALIGACSSVSPTMPSDVDVPSFNTTPPDGGTGSGNG
jgi:hypothetical protein